MARVTSSLIAAVPEIAQRWSFDLSPIVTTLATACIAALIAAPASALVVGGGGSAKTDCLVVFDAPATTPAHNPKVVRCADGDACDADGLVNGRCEFAVSVCANSTADPRCTMSGISTVSVAHSIDNGEAGFDPEMQAVATRIGFVFEYPESRPDRCNAPTAVHVPVLGPFAGNRCKKGQKIMQVTALSTPIDGRVRTDADKLKLICDPAPEGCTPRAFFTSTFDRIQTQIFDQSCAVGGCHDSQTVRAELLLEPGASYDNLVGKTPTNTDAANAGWHRITLIDPTHGDAATSYLVHKVSGDLPDGFGKRMPFNKPKLDEGLVDVIRRWVEAGAPAAGWVEGTD